MKDTYYEKDGITIYHGRCEEYLPELACVDLVLTDPPYGAGYATNPILGKNRFSTPHAKQDWDTEQADLTLVLTAGRDVVIWGGNYYSLPPSRGWLVWYKPDSLPSMADLELAWTSRDMNAKLISHATAATNAERVGHPTQKPLRVMRWCLSVFPDAKKIIDPYMGSGTTLRAAKDLGLEAIGTDIEEKYCEVAAKRLELSPGARIKSGSKDAAAHDAFLDAFGGEV